MKELDERVVGLFAFYLLEAAFWCAHKIKESGGEESPDCYWTSALDPRLLKAPGPVVMDMRVAMHSIAHARDRLLVRRGIRIKRSWPQALPEGKLPARQLGGRHDDGAAQRPFFSLSFPRS